MSLTTRDISYLDRVYAKRPKSYWDEKPLNGPPSCYVPGWGGDCTHQCLKKFENGTNYHEQHIDFTGDYINEKPNDTIKAMPMRERSS